MGLGNTAAKLHRIMCDDPRFGYSWDERWGGPETDTWNIDGRNFTLNVGDYDCSSSYITVWRLMVKGTPYEGVFNATQSTHTMRSVFLASGLFDWVPVSQAQPGDAYLNEQNHVAMCQTEWTLSEFSSNEYGGAHGGQRGDQTGWESHIATYYNYPWDGCLHYNGKLDGYLEEDKVIFIDNYGGDVYRVRNPKGFHYFTKSKEERDGLIAVGWIDEGVAFTTRRGGSDAVYLLYNPANGDHIYTVKVDEAAALQNAGWDWQGVPFFAWAEGTPIYRMYNRYSEEHMLTKSVEERDKMVKDGWNYEADASFTV